MSKLQAEEEMKYYELKYKMEKVKPTAKEQIRYAELKHEKNGDTYTLRKSKPCGCCEIYAQNSNIYDGGDLFTYTCIDCKEQDLFLKQEIAKLRKKYSKEFNKEKRLLLNKLKS